METIQIIVSNCLTQIIGQDIDHGHVTLVFQGTAYSYGRYESPEQYQSFGTLGPGTLKVYEGDNVAKLFQQYKSQGEDLSIFSLQFSAEEVSRLQDSLLANTIYLGETSNNYNGITINSTRLGYQDGRSIYDAFSTAYTGGANCATVVVDAVMDARDGFFDIETRPSRPWDLKRELERLQQNNPDTIDYRFEKSYSTGGGSEADVQRATELIQDYYNSQGTEPGQPVQNAITVITNNGNTTQTGALDPDASAGWVTNGYAIFDPTKWVFTNPDLLNSYQPAGVTLGMSLITDGWSPGNFGLAASVYAPQEFSLMPGYDFFQAVGLNSGLTRNYAPVDPLVLDLNGDGVRLTDYGSAPVLFDADNDGGSLENYANWRF